MVTIQKYNEFWFANAEIVAALDSDGMVFMSGEFSKWYNSSLGLTSVYRVVILLHPGVLLVVDHVAKLPKSRTRYVAAFFHNRGANFSLNEGQNGQYFSEVVLGGKTYRVLWSNSNGYQSTVRSQSAEYPAESGTRKTHYLNITTNLTTTQARLSYVFIAPGIKVTPPQLYDQKDGVRVSLRINNIVHLVSITTDYTTTQKRQSFLGFDGFAKVQVDTCREILFGDKERKRSDKTKCAGSVLHLSNINLAMLYVWLSSCIVRSFLFNRKKRFQRVLFHCFLCRTRNRSNAIASLSRWTALVLFTIIIVYCFFNKLASSI